MKTILFRAILLFLVCHPLCLWNVFGQQNARQKEARPTIEPPPATDGEAEDRPASTKMLPEQNQSDNLPDSSNSPPPETDEPDVAASEPLLSTSKGAEDSTLKNILAIIGGIAAMFAILKGMLFLYGFWSRRTEERQKVLSELDAQKTFEARENFSVDQAEEENYRNVLRNELGSIRILGSPNIENLPVNVLDAFVSLRISQTWRSERRFDPQNSRAIQDFSGDYDPDELMKRVFKQSRMLLIVGDPGSGKTTLMKYYAISCLTGNLHTKLGFTDPILPIYIPLRDLHPGNVSPAPLPENLARWARNHVQDTQPETFSRWLHHRKTLVLLDGLDEVSEVAQRRRVCEWIDNTVNGLSHAFFVVTTRSTGYRKAEGISLSCDHLRADVRDFTPAQQKEFLEKWFCAVARRENAEDFEKINDAQNRHRQVALDRAAEIADFLGREENKGLRELAAVPMLLQIMAIIWKERQVLPGSRAELYAYALHYLLEFRDKRRKLDPILPASKAKRALAPVALDMQRKNHDEVAKEELHAFLAPILKTFDEHPEPQKFCENIRDRAGLIADYGDKFYIFRHKSFREYLAGQQILTEWNEASDKAAYAKELIRHFGDTWWEEPFRYFISISDDQMFDLFMDALFRNRMDKPLKQNDQDLLQNLVVEAPQKRTGVLAKIITDGRIKNPYKKRYALECLKTIGSPEAIQTIKEFLAAERDAPEILGYASEIVSEKSAETLDLTQRPEVVIEQNTHSIQNPVEYNAEYILIPGGNYKYSVSGKELEVKNLYFAKYPVTNKRYQRFIRYLDGAEKELLRILPLQEYAEFLQDLASQVPSPTEDWITKFSVYLGEDVYQWKDRFQGAYADEKRFNAEAQPVVGVSWYAARAYCLWLSLVEWKTSRENSRQEKALCRYRLPDEREWEWAAGGGKRPYPWDTEKGGPTEHLANFGKNVGTTTPVSRYPQGSTPQGLMDMAGNAWEWAMNLYEPNDTNYYALRGGSWYSEDASLRCSARNCYGPDYHSYDFGFRVVRAQS